MTQVTSIKEFRANLSHFADLVEKGASVVVIRHSQPAFKVVPLDQEEKGWEDEVDFTEGGKKRGISAKRLLKIMKNFEKKHG